MLKGIVALFTSGAIFDPFVLFGIFMGFFAAFSSHPETIETLYRQSSFYLLLLLLAFLYNYFVKKVFKEDGVTPDYGRLFWNVIASVAKFIFSAVLSYVFVLIFLSF